MFLNGRNIFLEYDLTSNTVLYIFIAYKIQFDIKLTLSNVGGEYEIIFYVLVVHYRINIK